MRSQHPEAPEPYLVGMNHNARAAAPAERDYDRVVGSRGGAARWADRAVFGFATELAQTRMSTASCFRVANGTLKRPSDLRRLAPLAIM